MTDYKIELEKCFYDTKDASYNIVGVSADGKEKVLESSPVFGIDIPDRIEVDVLETTGFKIKAILTNETMDSFEQARIVAFRQKGVDMHTFVLVRKDNGFIVDVSSFQDTLEYMQNKNYKICLEVVRDGKYELYGLWEKEKQEAIGDRGLKNVRAVSYYTCEERLIHNENGENEIEHLCGMYSKRNGRLLFTSCTKKYFLSMIILCKLTGIKVAGNILKIRTEFATGHFEFNGVILSYRSKLEEDASTYKFEIVKDKLKGKNRVVGTKLDLSTIQLKSNYWDVFVVLKDIRTGNEYNIPLTIGKFKKKLRSFIYNDKYVDGEGNFLYPYDTVTGKIAFQYREEGPYDGYKFRIKERVAGVLYKVFKSYWKKKNIYLVFEKFSMTAQDNAYYFFKYCMENNEEEKLNGKIYYVIDKNSPDRKNVEMYEDHLIDFMSLKQIIYTLSAKVLISTDTKDHAYAWRRRNSILFGYLRHKQLVFLQHGVTALKKVDFLYGKGKLGGCDMFVVTSDYEKKIVEENFGYKGDEIAVTGFARWDVLNDKSEGSNEILIMPTWRNWLEDVSDEAFKKSDYYLNYMNLLNSDKLKQILEERDLKLNFYLHTKFRDYIQEFAIDSDRIRLIPFGEEPLNELMMTCRMLITDYSSVSWDVYYQDKPVVFYQFDLDKYEEAHGSYMDMRNEIFGDRVEQVDDLLELIDEYSANDFEMKPQYEEMRQGYFKYVDNDNSKRICECIKKKW